MWRKQREIINKKNEEEMIGSLLFNESYRKKILKRKFQGVYILEIANAILESVSYYDSFCDCGVKKQVLKNRFFQ